MALPNITGLEEYLDLTGYHYKHTYRHNFEVVIVLDEGEVCAKDIPKMIKKAKANLGL